MGIQRSAIYCVDTNQFVILESDPEAPGSKGTIISSGKIERRGNTWFFAGEQNPVCGKFVSRGQTMTGTNGPEIAAGKVILHKATFDNLCRRECGKTLEEHAAELRGLTGERAQILEESRTCASRPPR